MENQPQPEQPVMEPIQELHMMLGVVEKRAAELNVPSIVLIGLLHHCANIQSGILHVKMNSRQPTVAEQIMANRRPRVQ